MSAMRAVVIDWPAGSLTCSRGTTITSRQTSAQTKRPESHQANSSNGRRSKSSPTFVCHEQSLRLSGARQKLTSEVIGSATRYKGAVGCPFAHAQAQKPRATSHEQQRSRQRRGRPGGCLIDEARQTRMSSLRQHNCFVYYSNGPATTRARARQSQTKGLPSAAREQI